VTGIKKREEEVDNQVHRSLLNLCLLRKLIFVKPDTGIQLF